MPLQVALLTGAVVTVGTPKWLFTCVGSDVSLQIYLLNSTIGTVGTGKRLLSRVSAHVSS